MRSRLQLMQLCVMWLHYCSSVSHCNDTIVAIIITAILRPHYVM
ncbi:hypothetical protein Lalb_Chr07g0188891 [Lupinus albus]|uniref:Uncharacterized protein n=1 Tax=Lupinus albus TaxID=3870 RepID=A0A6A4QAL3_LUPAL|nr:hypothetical protein Lalb_Chr07g0188891 [Lupinus albus]